MTKALANKARKMDDKKNKALWEELKQMLHTTYNVTSVGKDTIEIMPKGGFDLKVIIELRDSRTYYPFCVEGYQLINGRWEKSEEDRELFSIGWVINSLDNILRMLKEMKTHRAKES